MVYNILGQIAGFLFFLVVVLFLFRLVWSLIPKLIREPLVFTIKGVYKVSKPILFKSKAIGKDVAKDMKPNKKKTKKVNSNAKGKSAKFKETKHSHLKIVK